ncbi:MAG: hypothetical protein EOM87_01685 [Clostridia bacterium]|nr:hypothetical protein [Clostridia bacterium]
MKKTESINKSIAEERAYGQINKDNRIMIIVILIFEFINNLLIFFYQLLLLKYRVYGLELILSISLIRSFIAILIVTIIWYRARGKLKKYTNNANITLIQQEPPDQISNE